MQNLHEQINAPHITSHKQAVGYLKQIDKMVKNGRRLRHIEEPRYVAAPSRHLGRVYANHLDSKRTVAQNKRGRK
jgi:hypothetical protein